MDSHKEDLPLDPNFETLLHQACEGTLSAEGEQQLAELLAASEAARRQYVEAMYLSTSVVGWARQTSEAAWHASVLPGVCPSPEAQPGQVASHTPSSRPAWRRVVPWVAAVAVCLLVGTILWQPDAWHPPGERGQMAAGNHPAERPPARAQRTRYVAHVVEATEDVRWGRRSAPFDLALRVRSGEKITVESGVLQLLYYSGAKVILHGPVTFTPTGPASGHLASGKLTGKVSTLDAAGFRLTTPTADVIDLGTEFGVAVDDTEGTDVCVFDGEVQVNSLLAGIDTRSPIRLTEGMSLRMTATGSANSPSPIDADQFLRELPPRSNSRLKPNEVSLVDAVIAGAGMSHRLYMSLDPTTGKPDEQPWRGGRVADEIGYRLAVYNEFVDGVFIPHHTGRNTLIDSYGNRVDLPGNTGHTEGAVWARRPVPNWTPGDPFGVEEAGEVWGMGATRSIFERLANCRLGVVGLHANLGISFDVHAIQAVEGRSAKTFRCIATNLDSSYDPNSTEPGDQLPRADVRVFVDGVERYACRDLRRRDGDQAIEIDLSPQCRVLTIVATDADYSVSHDQIVIIDPILELSE